jgi:anti-anti-sigma factor
LDSDAASVVVVRPRAGEALIECRGEHDLLTHSRLESLLAKEVSRNDLVIVDVREAEFIDSSFLHNLVKANELARRARCRFVLQFGTASTVELALQLSGLLRTIEYVHNRDELS